MKILFCSKLGCLCHVYIYLILYFIGTLEIAYSNQLLIINDLILCGLYCISFIIDSGELISLSNSKTDIIIFQAFCIIKGKLKINITLIYNKTLSVHYIQ